jgi:hypothetical protein
MSAAFLQRMLRENNPQTVLIRTLLIISQMARRAKVDTVDGMSANYDLIHKADIYSAVRKLLNHADAAVRMRVCNLVGAAQPVQPVQVTGCHFPAATAWPDRFQHTVTFICR